MICIIYRNHLHEIHWGHFIRITSGYGSPPGSGFKPDIAVRSQNLPLRSQHSQALLTGFEKWTVELMMSQPGTAGSIGFFITWTDKIKEIINISVPITLGNKHYSLYLEYCSFNSFIIENNIYFLDFSKVLDISIILNFVTQVWIFCIVIKSNLIDHCFKLTVTFLDRRIRTQRQVIIVGLFL